MRQSQQTFHYPTRTDLIFLKVLNNLPLKKKCFILTQKINKFFNLQDKVKVVLFGKQFIFLMSLMALTTLMAQNINKLLHNERTKYSGKIPSDTKKNFFVSEIAETKKGFTFIIRKILQLILMYTKRVKQKFQGRYFYIVILRTGETCLNIEIANTILIFSIFFLFVFYWLYFCALFYTFMLLAQLCYKETDA